MNSHTDQEYYNGVGLGGYSLDTIIMSGGGYYGIGYIGVFRFLEENNLREHIRDIYGVSAGAIMGLLFAIGVTATECRKLVLQDLDLAQLININSRMILNIPDRLGMNDGQYLIDTCKRLLNEKGLGEYCTFQELYDKRGIDLHVGVSLIFKHEFQIWDRHTRPDMPLWQAIRATTAIPIVFMPVIDYETCDLVCDGGIMNSNLIGQYLRNRVKNYTQKIEPHEKLHIVRIPGCYRNVGCQAGGDEDGKVYLDDQSWENSTRPRYRQTFWGLELCIKRFAIPKTHEDLQNVSLMDYLNSIIYKIYILQDSYRSKFRRLLQVFNCSKYNQISFANLKLSESDFDHIANDFYEQAKDYYQQHILTTDNTNTNTTNNTNTNTTDTDPIIQLES